MATSKKPMTEAQKAALAKAREALTQRKASSTPETGPLSAGGLAGEVMELKKLIEESNKQAEIRFSAIMKELDAIKVQNEGKKVKLDFLNKF